MAKNKAIKKKNSGIFATIKDINDEPRRKKEFHYGDIVVGYKTKRMYFVQKDATHPFILINEGAYRHLGEKYIVNHEKEFLRITNLADNSDLLKKATNDYVKKNPDTVTVKKK